MLLAGAGHHLGFDGHMDVGHDAGVDHHTDSGQDFQWLSIQSIASFAMGFGWSALGGLHGLHWDATRSAMLGGAGGAAMMYLLALVLKGMADLQTSGNIPIQSAVGQVGDVYLTVPASGAGRGQVKVNVDERQRIFNAVSGSDEIPTGTRIRVTGTNKDNTLTVVRA